MKSPALWMMEVEAECRASAPARSHQYMVTGRTRIDCIRERDSTEIAWYVNGQAVTPELAHRAIVHARAYPQTRFKG